jgi:uncharacterized repeat protein (TIGR03803 family)
MKMKFNTTQLATAARGAISIALTILSITASGWASEKVLFTFNSTDGKAPQAPLVTDASGNLYGATNQGGISESSCNEGTCGVVFKLTPNSHGGWTESVLYKFKGGKDGSNPYSGVALDSGGNLYGTTWRGGNSRCDDDLGCGTVYKLTPSSSGPWKKTILYKFTGNSDGGAPLNGVIFDAQGNLYGTASRYGSAACSGIGTGCGTVWELAPTLSGPWTETTLHQFTGTDGDGQYPNAMLAFDEEGNLYSTTGGGGNTACSEGCGTLFKLTSVSGGGWNYSVSYSFGPTTAGAGCNLIFDSRGHLYDCSGGAGTFGVGAVFELTPTTGGSWTESILYSFQGGTTDAAGPVSLLLNSAGGLWGTAAEGANSDCEFGCGAIFKLTPSGSGTWTETLPFLFDGTDGEYPNSLIPVPHGGFYGVASGGSAGDGVIFEFVP